MGLFAAALLVAPFLGAEFVPRLDEGALALQAWRLRDEHWLIYRQPITDDNQPPKRGFYSFSMEAPR